MNGFGASRAPASKHLLIPLLLAALTLLSQCLFGGKALASLVGCDDGSLIDVMIVYTPSALDAVGNQARMREYAEQAISETNAAFANSQVTTRLRLVYCGEVDYSEAGDNPQVLGQLRDPFDGVLDEVHVLRDQYGADIVSLWVKDYIMGGCAFTLHVLSHEFAANAFHVLRDVPKTVPRMGFAHELGHNLGCTHQEGHCLKLGEPLGCVLEDGACCSDADWHTIMKVWAEPGQRIPYYSNPSVLWEGLPTGRTDPCDPANNARHINDNTATIANFRQGIFPIDLPDRLFVDTAAQGDCDGLTWETAFYDLQDALCLAGGSGGQVKEVWVAEGTYRPDKSTGDRKAAFRLLNETTICGGFPSGGGTWEDRDPNIFRTVLSGDLKGDDETGQTNDNSYNVVSGSACRPTAVLDGFVISAGNADGDGRPFEDGGGIFIRWGRPTIRNCTFVDNHGTYGGGVYCRDIPCLPRFENCLFSRNKSEIDGGAVRVYRCGAEFIRCRFEENVAAGNGGAIANYEGNPVFSNCSFELNSTSQPDSRGGAVYDFNGVTMVSESVFRQNEADFGGAAYCRGGSGLHMDRSLVTDNVARSVGGGMRNHNSSPAVTNSVFCGNAAARHGGAMANAGSSLPTVLNCTVVGNNATQRCGGVIGDSVASIIVTNCILWGNTDSQGADELTQMDHHFAFVDYCCVQAWSGEHGGIGNICSDPLFVRSEEGDFHLKGESPCIDTGDPGGGEEPLQVDFYGSPRVANGRIDIGASEFTPE